MKRAFSAVLLLGVALGIGAGGYWFGHRNAGSNSQMSTTAATEPAPVPASGSSPERKILYYRDPMGKPDYSPAPKKDSMGMDYIPVYDDEATCVPPSQATAKQQGKGKLLYYRNPMGLPDTSAAPKKDSMGMDYIPVYENDEADGSGTVKVSPARVQMLGVRSEPAEMRNLARTVRAVGTVQPDERKLFVVNTKFEGWIEKLRVNATGQSVRRGEPLMEVYAPELVVAQQEYLLSWRSLQDMSGAHAEARASSGQLADAALQRLRNWDISDDQIKLLQRSGTITRTLKLRAPADGVVMDKTAVEGMRFMAGEPLYRIADLSTVWLIADVFEQDLGVLRDGQEEKVTVNAYPGVNFPGKVDFIYPTVAQETRTGKVRIVIANGDGRLKPGMYGDVALEAPLGNGVVLAIPDSAVIDSGARQIVLVDRGEGKFEPREVKLGTRADGYYEVRSGLKPDEMVVVTANFLIDAESNLKAALKSFTAPDAGSNTQPNASSGAAGGKS